MEISGQAPFDAVSGEFLAALAALQRRAAALKPGKDRQAILNQMRPEIARGEVVISALGEGSVPADQYLEGLKILREATARLKALDVEPPKKGFFRRR